MNLMWEWYKSWIRPAGATNRIGVLVVERACLPDVFQFVKPEHRDQLIDGLDVPSTIDPTIWIEVKENR